MSTFDDPTGQPVTLQKSQQQHGQPEYAPQQYAQPQYGQPYQQQAPGMYMQPMPGAPAPYARPMGPAGKVRSTWAVIGLSIITLGIYSLYYQFAVHQEMKDHSGEGIGGVVALILAIFTGGLVISFVLPHEVGTLYARQGRPRPVSATTGLWAILGCLIIVGPLVWLIKTNGALNAYWRSLGVR
jgi:Domain of unknown function (DUF4234)